MLIENNNKSTNSAPIKTSNWRFRLGRGQGEEKYLKNNERNRSLARDKLYNSRETIFFFFQEKFKPCI